MASNLFYTAVRGTLLSLFLALAHAVPALGADDASPATRALADIRVRDPFILADPASRTYFLYRQIANGRGPDASSGLHGVEVFSSTDLATWSGPNPVFIVPADFWARQMVWAPEVHAYRGKYYLLVTFTATDLLPDAPSPGGPPKYRRGTQILVADSPRGPFQPFSNRAHTPADWMALDGTLFVEAGVPYMVFCREWAQVHDGTMELMPLKPDLSAPAGPPHTLFSAKPTPWVKSLKDAGGKYDGYITDGPFLHRTQTGKLLMIWSSFGAERYAIGLAVSASGKIAGPWHQLPDTLVVADGGHGMIFRTFAGQLTLVYHQPNRNSLERARLFPLDDSGDTLRVIKP
jgi:beta-xylosidase